MHFKSIATFVALLLSATVLAAPVSDTPTDVVQLFARAITVSVTPSEKGDYKELAEGRPHCPPRPPRGSKKKDIKNWEKVDKKCKNWDSRLANFKSIVSPRVEAAIRAAEHTLHLTGHLEVHVTTAHHLRLQHDDLKHWTFEFSAPSCGGECTGHAYKSGAGREALVWNALSKQVFPEKTEKQHGGH